MISIGGGRVLSARSAICQWGLGSQAAADIQLEGAEDQQQLLPGLVIGSDEGISDF